MGTSVKILLGISDLEKGAYLSAIASIATADSQASQTEIDHLSNLCEAAYLSAEQQQLVISAARNNSDAQLVQSLDVLKNSELKYSLVTDLFAFAKSDANYSETEQQSVQKIANYLGVDQKQFELLGELDEKTNNSTVAPTDEQGFMSAFGLGDKLKESGINGGGLLKGLVSIAAPLIIAKMMGGNNRSSGAGLGGMLGNVLGGAQSNSGGLGGMLGNALGGGQATAAGNTGILGGRGLGSLIGMLGGGKGMGAAGGLLGRIFG